MHGRATPIDELKKALTDAGLERINIDVKEESRSFIKEVHQRS